MTFQPRHDSMDSMNMGSGMTMASGFLTATNTPLYSASWTPQNASQYAGTCIFLIILAIVFRALFTAKSFLEAKATANALKRRYVVVAGEKTINDQAMDESSSVDGVLTTNGLQENVRVVSAPVKHSQPWRFSVDLPRALLMTIAAAIGYFLMLAVMTYNVGYFMSILAGTFIGELALGRLTDGAGHSHAGG